VRRFFPALVLAALVALIAGPSVAQSPPPGPLVDVLYSMQGPSSGTWPLYIAEHEGYFRDEGIHFVLVQFNNPQDIANAVSSNAANLGDVQTDTSIDAVAHNLNIRIVAPTLTTVPYRLVVLPTITQWQQLKGATVSLGSRNGSTILSYKRLLKLHNVDDSDFQIVVAGNSTLRLAALKTGNVQATMLAQPFDFLAQSQGLRILADSSQVMGKDWVFSAMLMNNTWGNANRALVVRFLHAYRRAIQFGYAHRDETVAILETPAHIDRETAEKTYDLTFTQWKGFDPNLRINPSALLAMGKALVDFRNIAKVPAVSEMYDGSYAAAAAR
jgi:ABC-type nitrate/sulfonate/bicarbonate transport system substrate-binding protein